LLVVLLRTDALAIHTWIFLLRAPTACIWTAGRLAARTRALAIGTPAIGRMALAIPRLAAKKFIHDLEIPCLVRVHGGVEERSRVKYDRVRFRCVL